MELLEVEKYVALRGVLGCPLDELPSALINQITDSKILAIVSHEDNLKVPDSLQHNIPETPFYKLAELSTFKGYDIRLFFERWRMLAFNNSKIHAGSIANFVSLLMNHPEGIKRRIVKLEVPNAAKNIHKWIVQLKKEKLIRIEVENGEETFFYNYDTINNAKIGAEPVSNIKTRQSIKVKNEEPEPEMEKIEFSYELVNSASKVIKEHENGMPIKSIRTFFRLDPDVLNELIKSFDNMKEFEVIRYGESPTKIKYVGGTETSNTYVENDVVNFLVDMCRTVKIILISELPKDIKKMKTSMRIEDDKFLDILEDNGFSILEIRSKYINPEFVVFFSDISENDPDLISTVNKAKAKVLKHFKIKVKFTFLKNMYLNSFDNNFLPSLKQRVYHLYKFIAQEIDKNNGYFCFNQQCILNMNFLSFIKCVPLRLDFQFIKIVLEIAKKNKKIKNAIDLPENIENVEDISAESFDKLNNSCLSAVSSYTVKDILLMLKKDSEIYNGLFTRVNVLEFFRILQCFIKYNVFEGFISDNNDYLYYEQIEGIENYIEKIFNGIIDDSSENSSYNAFYSDRKKLYDMICDFSQEEFYSKTFELIEENFTGESKDFFIKKLQTFK